VAAELGLSTIGIAPYDERYTFAEFSGRGCGETVVVCVLEQNYAATQTIPSLLANRAAYNAEADCILLSARLADALCEWGFRARTHGAEESIAIHYGVQAGLGQLGLNGQLLTPAAGSRCRLAIVTTDAPLSYGKPIDYGIERICDACKACVRRCPSGAIPAIRSMHRGVRKAKINTARCLPVVGQANGCAICMKVCPVQRYGLQAVHAEFERTGRVKGVHSDELEGYQWPVDGKFYGADARPRLDPQFFRPQGYLLQRPTEEEVSGRSSVSPEQGSE
jgi:Pyruvate/2-oxoacid:ferredoxin oxidoreductase delta subunit